MNVLRYFLALITTVFATGFSKEFIKGGETGMFLASKDQLQDYNCPEPIKSETITGLVEMFESITAYLESYKLKHREGPSWKDSLHCILVALTIMLDKAAVVFTLMQGGYEGGDFCSGLTIGFEAKDVLTKAFGGNIR